MQDVAKYIQQQNTEVYKARGIIIGDPMDRGLRCVSSLTVHCLVIVLCVFVCVCVCVCVVMFP